MQTKNNFKEHITVVFLSIILVLIIFHQFYFKGLIPFPGNYMLAWYEPWKTDYSTNGTITIPHKPVADDVFRQLYPSKVLISDFIKQMQFPLWNPYNGSGMPLLATMHVGFLNPLNLLFVFLPKHIAWGMHVSIQPILISFFTYLYCRKIGIKFLGSLLSSITFVLSGPVIVRLLFGEYIYNFWILPILLYLIESYINNPKAKIVWLFPFTITSLFISGQPQIITYILIFSFCYFIYRLFQIKKGVQKLSANFVFFIIILTAIGIGLAGIQLLPTLELFGQASINPSSSKFIFDRFLLPIQHLITIFIPNYFGNQSTYNYWGSGDYIETIASVGLVPLFFVFLSIGRINTRIDLRKFYFAAIALTIIFTLDWVGTRLFYSIPIPIISTGIPSRIFALTVFCISILAGYGFDKWLTAHKEDFKEIKKYTIKFCVFITIILVGTFLIYILKVTCNNELILNCRNIALRNTLAETGIFAIALFLFWRKIIPFVTILLVLGIGIYNSNKFLPFSAKNAILPQHTLISQLQRTTRNARVFGLGSANLKTDFATYFKLYDPNYYDPLYNKRYGEFISYANLGKLPTTLPRSDIEITADINLEGNDNYRRNRLLNFLSVEYLIFKKSEIVNISVKDIIWQDNNWIITQNLESLPRAYTVNSYEVINDKEKLLTRLFDPKFDPTKDVILEKEPTLLLNPTLNNNKNINFINYKENQVSLKVNTGNNQILVLTDNYYPGWKAYLDNKETEIYRANYTLRAIFIPEGKHNIFFKYQPESFKIGIIISLASLIILIITYSIKSKLKLKE